MSVRGIGLILISISTSGACGLPISVEALYEIVKQKYNLYKKQFEKDQQTIKSSDKIYRKNLYRKKTYRTQIRSNVIDKNEYESLCNNFTKNLDETENESFL